jgi:hypothetical protein
MQRERARRGLKGKGERGREEGVVVEKVIWSECEDRDCEGKLTAEEYVPSKVH